MSVETEPGQTKYGTLIDPLTRWRLNHHVVWSTHALDRWDERTPQCSISPLRAWDCGVDLDAPSVVDADDPPDRARVFRSLGPGGCLDEPYTVCWIVRNQTVVTTLRARQCHRSVRSRLREHDIHFGGGGGRP